MSKQALMTTTDANHIDTSDMPTLTGFTVVETCPSGTSTRYVVKAGDGNWQKYSGSAWADVATQSLTAASVMSEGNTADELNAVPASAMTGFVGKTIDVAAALQTNRSDKVLPEIKSFTVKGRKVTEEHGHQATYTVIEAKAENGYKLDGIRFKNGVFIIVAPPRSSASPS